MAFAVGFVEKAFVWYRHGGGEPGIALASGGRLASKQSDSSMDKVPLPRTA